MAPEINDGQMVMIDGDDGGGDGARTQHECRQGHGMRQCRLSLRRF